MIISKLKSKHLGYRWPTKKFHAMQSQPSVVLKSLFWRSPNGSAALLPLKGVSKMKNHHYLTFGNIKSDWGIIGCSRFFLRIGVIISKLKHIHLGYLWPTEKHFMPYKANRQLYWNPFFEGLQMDFQGGNLQRNHVSGTISSKKWL